ncbi:uncharacterized protein LOC143211893 [Lasioglossum baleicum]|uniref:uncharacterized protein LOC143211893 n=1 Tax=Lasioglossum baleicum TaxID=434251 RepID=UPI003FCD4CA2
MLTSGLSNGGEEHLIFLLICCCLISILTLEVFLCSLDGLWLFWSDGTARSKFEEFATIHPEPRKLLRDRQPRGNQFLARTATENERNYVDFVLVKKLQSTTVYTIAVEGMDKNLSKENITNASKDSRRNSTLRLEYSRLCDVSVRIQENITNAEYGNGSLAETLIKRDPHDKVNTRTVIKDSQDRFKFNMIDKEDSDRSIKLRFNVEDAFERIQRNNGAVEVISHGQSKKPISQDEIICQESLELSSNESSELINEDIVSQEICSKMDGDGEKYAGNASDCGNRAEVTPGKDENCRVHKFEAHFEIGRSNFDETVPGKYSANSKMKLEEGLRTTAILFPARNLPTSAAEKIDKFGTESNRSFNEKIITSKSFGPGTERSFENEFTEEANGENYEATSCHDERRSNMAVDSSEERLSPTQRDAEIWLRNEDDYLGEQFRVAPEKGANRIEGKSITHSYESSTQSREQLRKEEAEIGPPPVTDAVRNYYKNDVAVLITQPSAVNSGKEEEDLNAIIRRMIIMELRKRCRKEQATLKRAHSDTDSMMPKKTSSTKRTGLLSLKGHTVFQGKMELEESLREKIEEKCRTKLTGMKFDESSVEQKHSSNQDKNYRKNKSDVDAAETYVANGVDNLVNSTKVVDGVHSNILLERKINVPCLRDDLRTKELSAAQKFLIMCKHGYACKSTQTEHVYVIRAVRSCPLRKRRFSLHLQLERLATRREAVCSMTVYASRDFSKYIFRKASDNLIYEKGKGSRSPSYIAAPQRFRWRYVTPKTIA